MNKYICAFAIVIATVLATLVTVLILLPSPNLYIDSSQVESVAQNQQRSPRLNKLMDKLNRSESLSPEEFAEFKLLGYEERQELSNRGDKSGGGYLEGNYPENNLTSSELDDYLSLSRKIVSNGDLSLTPRERERYLFLSEKSVTPQK